MQTQESEDASASTSSKTPVDSESEMASSTIAPDTVKSNIKGITLVAPYWCNTKFNFVRSNC